MAVNRHRPDIVLLISIVSVVLFGIVMIYSASVIVGLTNYNDPQYFFKRQIIWAILGLIGLVITANVDYRTWKKWAGTLLIVTLILLASVFFFGHAINGAHRWIGAGSYSFQPSELAKFTFVVYISAWLCKQEERIGSIIETFIPFLGVLAVVSVLMLLEPDFGTLSIILASSISVFVVAGMTMQELGVGLGTAIAALSAILAVPYRRNRILTFFHPSNDTSGISYQVKNIAIAIGSGGWFGLGYGASGQKRMFLPEPHTDSIFAVITEELGFVVAAAVVGAFLLILYRGYRIAAQAQDSFGRLLAIGITSWFAFQAFINLASMVHLVPLVGVPLPFISYGGTNLVISMAAVGVLLNISRYTVNSSAPAKPKANTPPARRGRRLGVARA